MTDPHNIVWAEAFGAVLKARRKALGMSIGDTEKLTGVRRQHICAYERGERMPQLPMLAEFALALQWDTGELVMRIERELYGETQQAAE